MQNVTTFSLAGWLRQVPRWLSGSLCVLCAFGLTGCTSLELELAANPGAWSNADAAQWETATAFERQQDFAAARQHYLALQQTSPLHPGVTHRLGVVCTHLGYYDEAERALLAALRQRPMDPDIHNDLGYLHHLQGHLGLAKMQYQEALALRPSDPLITSNLAAVERTAIQQVAKAPVIKIPPAVASVNPVAPATSPSLRIAPSPTVNTASWDSSEPVVAPASAVSPVSPIQTVAFEAPATPWRSTTPTSDLPPLPSDQPPVPASLHPVPVLTQAVSTTQLTPQPAVPQKLPQITPGSSSLPLVRPNATAPAVMTEPSPVLWGGHPTASEVTPADSGWNATSTRATGNEATDSEQFERPLVVPPGQVLIPPRRLPAEGSIIRAQSPDPARKTPQTVPSQRHTPSALPETAIPVPDSLMQSVAQALVPAAPALPVRADNSVTPVSGEQSVIDLPPEPAHFAVAPMIPDAPCEVATPPSAEAAPFPDDDAANAFLESHQAEIALQGDATVMKGFCPVTLRDQRQLVAGSSSYWFEYQGVRYQFASLAARTQFCSHPEWYIPVSNGQDLVSQQDGTAVTGRLDFALWYARRLYVFDSIDNLHRFRKTPGHFAGL